LGVFRSSAGTPRAREDVLRASDARNQLLTDRLSHGGIERAKSFGAFRFDAVEYDARSALLNVVQIRLFTIYAVRNLALFLSSTAIGQGAALAAGGFLIMRGRATIGELVAFIGIQAMLFGPLHLLAVLQASLAANEVVQRRLLDLLHADEETGAHVLDDMMPIAVHRPVLRAPFDRDLLRDVALEVSAGSWIGIVGESGSGKSTLARLLVRFAESDGAAVTAGHRDVNSIAPASLRSRVIVLPQQDSLFAGTVRENLCCGTAFSDGELFAALRAVRLDERFAMVGLDTPIGAVSDLSGGEKQRIALARAVLRRPAVLVLDEATSGIDLESEAAALRWIREEVGCAVIMITHRTQSLREFDEIYRLADRCLIKIGG
jgi:ABC-type multidrug transport system fused ATPase/permease subunit